MKKPPRLLGPFRSLVQRIAIGLFFLVPFLRIDKKSLFRIDIADLTLDLFWQTFHIEELYLFWILILAFAFGFILATLILGRVWCGWLCPQTTLSDLADSLMARLKIKPEAKHQKVSKHLALHISYSAIALLFGTVFVWYFLPPGQYISLLLKGSLGAWPLGSTIVIALLTYINLAFVRRLFCKEFCPYGRFQTVLVDKSTLTLQAHPNHLERCVDCKACCRVCPTGIDIRNGFQIECINCAKCLDACRKVMTAKGESGIIQYTFGKNDLGWRSLLNPKIITLSTVVTILLTVFGVLATHRTTVTFKVGRSPSIESRLLADNQQMTFFSGSISNHSKNEQTYIISAERKDNNTPLTVKGPRQIVIAAGQKQTINFAILSKVQDSKQPYAIIIGLCNLENSCIQQKAFISPMLQ